MQFDILWEHPSLKKFSLEQQHRIKELCLMLIVFRPQVLLATDDLKQNIRIIKSQIKTEFYQWTEELRNLAESDSDLLNFLEEVLFEPTQALLNLRTGEPNMDACEILRMIEQYQNFPPVIKESNYGKPIYCDDRFAEKIELLYRIGTLANILPVSKFFDSSTKVTQTTQDVCNMVCKWVESNLSFHLEPVNVYEPLIWDYKQYPPSRARILVDVGIRSGLLSTELDVDSYKLTTNDSHKILGWIASTYQVKLQPPSKYYLEDDSQDQTNSTSKQFFDFPFLSFVSYLFLYGLLLIPFIAAWHYFSNDFVLLSEEEHSLYQHLEKHSVVQKLKLKKLKEDKM